MADHTGQLVPKLDTTLGAAFLGNIFSAIFYGITTLQMFTYFMRAAQRDALFLRSLIMLLWVLDTLHVALVTHGLYFYLISNFMNVRAIASPTWSMLTQVHVTCISDLLVRAVFTWRLWHLSKGNILLAGASVVTSLFTAITGSIFASYGMGRTFAHLFQSSWLMYASLSGAVASDLIIALSLIYYLKQNRSGFKDTDSLVSTLVTYTINTSLLTSLCAIGCLVTFSVWPNDFIFIGIYFMLGKLYFNALLASLNARDALRERSLQSSSGFASNSQGLRNGTQSMSIARSPLTTSASMGSVATPYESAWKDVENDHELGTLTKRVPIAPTSPL